MALVPVGSTLFFPVLWEIAPLAEHTSSVLLHGLQASRTSSSPTFTLPFPPSHGGRGSKQTKFDVDTPLKWFPIPARGNSVRTMLI